VQRKETHWNFWHFLFDPGIKTSAKTVLATVCTHSILRVIASDSSHDHLCMNSTVKFTETYFSLTDTKFLKLSEGGFCTVDFIGLTSKIKQIPC
jgi:hypothetical protein